MAKIKVVEGSYNATCTTDKDLIENQIKFPQISDILMYAEQRMISTLIVSGVENPFDAAAGETKKKTKIGKIPELRKDGTGLIGDNAYKYRLQGRIQKASVINDQVGSSESDGTFHLSMKDNRLYPGMNAFFSGDRLQARVMGAPRGNNGNYIYEFKTVDGTVFDWAIHVSPQEGEKTCFGGFTSYGEKSIRGFSRHEYPDMFVNHTTIQRKSCAMSGSSQASVLWVEFNGQKGWMPAQLAQDRTTLMLEDEHAKWWGKSTMKDSNGDLRNISRLISNETSQPIIQGDGVFEQIEGRNVSYGSGTNGKASRSDFNDMMNTLKKKSNTTTGNKWYVITGPGGMETAQSIMRAEAQVYNITHNQNTKDEVGGGDADVGYTFQKYNWNGNQLLFVEHPMFGDEERWSERTDDGELVMENTMVFLDVSKQRGKSNCEILGRGAYGTNRTMVSGKLRGLTGSAMKQLNLNTSVDADEYHMLKEDGLFIYNTSACGIIYPSTS